MFSIFYHTQESFAEHIFSLFGKGRCHARRLYSHFMKRGRLEGFVVERHAQPLIAAIQAMTDFSLPPFRVVEGAGETKKVIVQVQGRLEVEAVCVPMQGKTTLCVSSQVGCKMGCAFCQTGQMGLLGQLSIADIVVQVFIARHKLRYSVDHLVFMGMGEPLDNFDAVVGAIAVLTQDGGLAFGPSHISVSTSGMVDEMDRFAAVVDPAVKLAVSVNAPNDAIRRRIMPINQKWNLTQLKAAMERFCSHPRRQILVEYVLLEGINDSIACATQLAHYLRGLRVKVNLIPYNPQSRDRFSPPQEGVIRVFKEQMQKNGYLTFLRQAKGQQIMAACGQLGNLELRKVAGHLRSSRVLDRVSAST